MKKFLSVILVLLTVFTLVPISGFSAFAVAKTETKNLTAPVNEGTSTTYDFMFDTVKWEKFEDTEKVVTLSFTLSYNPTGGKCSFRVDTIDKDGNAIEGNKNIFTIGSQGEFHQPDGTLCAKNSKGSVNISLTISLAQNTYGYVDGTATNKIVGSFTNAPLAGMSDAVGLRFTFNKIEASASFTNIKFTYPVIDCEHENTSFDVSKTTADEEVFYCSDCESYLYSSHNYSEMIPDSDGEHYVCQNEYCAFEKTTNHNFIIDGDLTNDIDEAWKCKNIGCTYSYTTVHNYPEEGTEQEDGMHFVCSNEGCGHEKIISDKLLFSEETMYFNDFDNTPVKNLPGGFGFCTEVVNGSFDKSVFVVSLDGNEVLKPNGADGQNTTWLMNLRGRDVIAKFTDMVFDLRIDTPLVSGTEQALYFDHIGAGKESAGGSTPQKKIQASYLSVGTDEKGTYIFTGGSSADRYYITLGEWNKVVVNMPGVNGGTCKGFVKPKDSDNYFYIGSHSNVRCYGKESYQQAALYMLPVSGFTYYIDNFYLSESGQHSKIRTLGYQTSEVKDGKYSLRFIVGVDGIYNGQETVGFDIECVSASKSWEGVNTSSVYKTLYANFGESTIKADDFDCAYITGVVIKNIPAETEIGFTIKPYTVIDGKKTYGNEAKVTVMP